MLRICGNGRDAMVLFGVTFILIAIQLVYVYMQTG